MHVNGKNTPVETISQMGGGRIKENEGGGWIQVWYIIITFVTVTMYSLHNNKKKSLFSREVLGL
jgi:hypothetical protein